MTAPLRMSAEMLDEQAEIGTLDGASLAYRLSDNKCGQSELDSSVIWRPVVGKPVGVQCETVELTTARVQIDENDNAGVRPVMTAPLMRMSGEMPDEQAETETLDGASLAYRHSDNKCGQSELDSSVIWRPVVGKPVGVQCETVELTTARVQIDKNDDAGARPSLEAHRQCLVDDYEAGCDEDASPKSTCGPLETMLTDVAASNESPTATIELGQEASDGEDSESDAPYTPELDIVFDALVELAGEDWRDWVLMRQIQAQTSLRLWRPEELLEGWECVGVQG